ncbi:MAG: type I glyceraldehyde-3-phosphate dehydrogenase [Bdellovibrionales bacterium]|nr:type I glyceraldehyde-3-phosphate dehydrogenase [Bdellovibrionales bacterium]
MKIGINGFGRIGRNVFRHYVMNRSSYPNLEIVAINDLTSAETLAHLLQYDSVHGKLPEKVTYQDNALSVAGVQVKVTAEKDPSALPWKEMGVDMVFECTGIFTKREGAAKHLAAGAKRVLISAPSPDPDLTMAYGVNSDAYNPAEHEILSCASCTTNCLAPVAKVLDEHFGIVRGTMTTIHSYTNDQRILDLPHKDLRRARAAALSLIPTSTGAAKAVGLVLPHLKGKIDGFAVRVPTPDASLVDFVAEVKKGTTVDEVNKALKAASESGPLKGILGYSDEPLVSVDYIGDIHSSTVDALSTMVIEDTLVKVVAWYDNEMGFSVRMLNVSNLIVDKG